MSSQRLVFDYNEDTTVSQLLDFIQSSDNKFPKFLDLMSQSEPATSKKRRPVARLIVKSVQRPTKKVVTPVPVVVEEKASQEPMGPSDINETEKPASQGQPIVYSLSDDEESDPAPAPAPEDQEEEHVDEGAGEPTRGGEDDPIADYDPILSVVAAAHPDLIPADLLGPRFIAKTTPVKPDGNCMFKSLEALFRAADPEITAAHLRRICGLHISSRPAKFNTHILGESPETYVIKLAASDEWGSAVELQILAEESATEIAAMDISANRCITFGQGLGYTKRVYLAFSGNHYDPLFLTADGQYVGMFSPTDGAADARFRAYITQEHRQGRYHDTSLSTTILKCMDCGKLFKGRADMLVHANQSQHQNYGPPTEEEKKYGKIEKVNPFGGHAGSQAHTGGAGGWGAGAGSWGIPGSGGAEAPGSWGAGAGAGWGSGSGFSAGTGGTGGTWGNDYSRGSTHHTGSNFGSGLGQGHHHTGSGLGQGHHGDGQMDWGQDTHMNMYQPAPAPAPAPRQSWANRIRPAVVPTPQPPAAPAAAAPPAAAPAAGGAAGAAGGQVNIDDILRQFQQHRDGGNGY